MKSHLLALALLLAALSIPTAAAAYVDPGTGSYFLQILIAGILGAAFTLKLYWRRIKSFLTGTRSGQKGAEEERQAGEDGKG